MITSDYLPTDALPGSNRKIDVMRERASRGQEIFHPLDARWDTSHQTFARMLLTFEDDCHGKVRNKQDPEE